MRAGALALAVWAWAAVASAAPSRHAFTATSDGEAIATVVARCPSCDWGVRGREAAVLRARLDDGAPQDVVLFRGEEPAEYAIALGPVAAGSHTLVLEHDPEASAAAAGVPALEKVEVRVTPRGERDHAALAHAPWIHARPDALRRFSDVPLLLWWEEDPLPAGRRFRYSVVFSNEDGGTPPDRLMATWGRLTDIEYVYGVELDDGGRVVREEYQGRGHRIVPFRGRRVGRHPLLWVVTENNMLDTRGKGARRMAPAPFPFDLTRASREAVMDAHPWTYAISAAEARREGRVSAGARPGSRRVPDPRRFVMVEACAETRDAALTFSMATRGPGGLVWHESDGGQPAFRIQRSADHFPNGCFRGAVALPAGVNASDLAAIRFRAHTRAVRKGEPPVPPGHASARLVSVNRLYTLDDRDHPGPDLFRWQGDLPLAVDGPPAEIPIPTGVRSCNRAFRHLVALRTGRREPECSIARPDPRGATVGGRHAT